MRLFFVVVLLFFSSITYAYNLKTSSDIIIHDFRDELEKENSEVSQSSSEKIEEISYFYRCIIDTSKNLEEIQGCVKDTIDSDHDIYELSEKGYSLLEMAAVLRSDLAFKYLSENFEFKKNDKLENRGAFLFYYCFSLSDDVRDRCVKKFIDLGYDLYAPIYGVDLFYIVSLGEGFDKSVGIYLEENFTFSQANQLFVALYKNDFEKVKKILQKRPEAINEKPSYTPEEFSFVGSILESSSPQIVKFILEKDVKEAILSSVLFRKLLILSYLFNYDRNLKKEWQISGLFEDLIDGNEEAYLQQFEEKSLKELEELHPKLGLNIFQLSVLLGKGDLVEKMIKKGVNPHLKDRYGADALFMAINSQNKNVVSLLMNRHKKPVRKLNEKKSTLNHAWLSQEQFLKILSEEGDSDKPKVSLLEAARKHTGLLQLKDITFTDIKINQENLKAIGEKEIDFSHVNFNDCEIVNVDFSKIGVFFDSKFTNCLISYSAFKRSDFSQKSEFIDSFIYFSSFVHADMSGMKFKNTDIYISDFMFSNLSYAEFEQSNLIGNNFLNSHLNSVKKTSSLFNCNLGISSFAAEQKKCQYPHVSTLTEGHFKSQNGSEGVGMNEDMLVSQMLSHGVFPVAFDYTLDSYDFNKTDIKEEVLTKVLIPKNLNSTSQNLLNNISPSGQIKRLDSFVNMVVSEVDGFMLPGGLDIFPLFYGDHYHQKTKEDKDEIEWKDFDDYRFLAESLIIKAMESRKKPLFGVCRGNQAINVFFGGVLNQHVEGQNSVTQTIPIDKHEGWVGSVLKGKSTVGISNHHQAVKIPGRGIEIVGGITGPDGIFVPKILQGTSPDFPLFLFQFHPENNLNEENEMYMFAYFNLVRH